MIFKSGKYAGRELMDVVELDPQYVKWLSTAGKDFYSNRDIILHLNQNKDIIEKIDKNLSVSREKYITFLTIIEKHIVMSALTGSRRGIIFLEKMKQTLENGMCLSKMQYSIVVDIIARGPYKKPIRRNNKKYLESRESLEEHANIVSR